MCSLFIVRVHSFFFLELDKSMKEMKARADGELRRGDPLFSSQEFMEDFSNPLFTDTYVPPSKKLVRQPSEREAKKGRVVQLDASFSGSELGPQGTTFKPIADPTSFNGIMTNSQPAVSLRRGTFEGLDVFADLIFHVSQIYSSALVSCRMLSGAQRSPSRASIIRIR